MMLSESRETHYIMFQHYITQDNITLSLNDDDDDEQTVFFNGSF